MAPCPIPFSLFVYVFQLLPNHAISDEGWATTEVDQLYHRLSLFETTRAGCKRKTRESLRTPEPDRQLHKTARQLTACWFSTKLQIPEKPQTTTALERKTRGRLDFKHCQTKPIKFHLTYNAELRGSVRLGIKCEACPDWSCPANECERPWATCYTQHRSNVTPCCDN